MPEMLTTISTGLTAFTATNLDDIVILMLFFSQVNDRRRQRQIVVGQYLGLGVLVLASLPGCFGRVLFPRTWIGLLGLVPIAIGLTRCLDAEPDATETATTVEPGEHELSRLLSSQTYSVAAITVANGGDNIGIYMPLFASTTGASLLVMLAVFFSMVGVWCYIAARLAALPAIATALTRYGKPLVPFVLISLGVLILFNSYTLEDRGLTVLALLLSSIVLLHLLRTAAPAPALFPSKIEKT